MFVCSNIDMYQRATSLRKDLAQGMEKVPMTRGSAVGGEGNGDEGGPSSSGPGNDGSRDALHRCAEPGSHRGSKQPGETGQLRSTRMAVPIASTWSTAMPIRTAAKRPLSIRPPNTSGARARPVSSPE